MKKIIPFIAFLFFISGCKINTHTGNNSEHITPVEEFIESLGLADILYEKPVMAEDINISKELSYDKYTLDDVYPYKDTVRSIKWGAIKKCLAYVENMKPESGKWCVIQNYRNINGEAALVKSFTRDEYKRVADTLGVERYQSIPFYSLTDTVTPVVYGRDGTLNSVLGSVGGFYHIIPATTETEWYVPKSYVKFLPDSTVFHHVIIVDRGDQNITTLEREDKALWKVRSINPATTGRHAPPHAQETPLGMYLLQQKKEKMLFLKDGSSSIGGYAPYASRFTNGAYIHGVPVNLPDTKMIEYSWSLGTTPRSHMCVRNATSHAKFIYDWAPKGETLIVVIE